MSNSTPSSSFPVIDPKIEESWKKELSEEFNKPYFRRLKQFLDKERQEGKIIYPRGSHIFNAFYSTPFDKVRVVILGQDPYHGAGQAHGLSFSVPSGVKPPPSLKNIFKELQTDCGITPPAGGDLSFWAKQGVLLLNATLTVRASSPGSHQKQGWEEFTDAVIQHLSDKKEGLVFLLWGSYAQAKGAIVDSKKHYVLKAAHPSPFSAHSGFFGCRHFSKTNNWLQKRGEKPIEWSLQKEEERPLF